MFRRTPDINRSNRLSLHVDSLENRLAPAVFPIPAGAVALAPDDGGIPRIKIIDPTTGEDIGEIQAYEDAFRGGVHVALGDVNGDGVRDVAIAPGNGGGPRVRVIDGKSGSILMDTFVYEESFRGGVYVAVGDVNHDGRGDLILGTGKDGGPRVRVLDGASNGTTVLKDYFAYESTFRGGVLVSSGDVNGDGSDDVIAGAGVGGGPRVIAFSGADDRVLRNFFAYEDSFRGGVMVSSGDLDGDGFDDIITGTGPGGGPVVRAYDGQSNDVILNFLADDSAFRGGVRIDSRDVDGDSRSDVLSHTRHGNDVSFRTFNGVSGGFLRSLNRTVDDNPSPGEDSIQGGQLVPGTVSALEGAIVAVNPVNGTIDLRLGNGQIVVIQSGPGTNMERNGIHTTLTTFVVGETGEALIGPDGIAWEIEAKSVPFGGGNGGGGSGGEVAVGKVEGVITATNTTAGTVSIRRAGGTVVVVHAGPLTKIERNDVTVSLTAFVIGDRGEALIGSDGVATKVEAYPTTGGGGTGGTGGGTVTGIPLPANANVEGTITAIDLALNRVTIRTLGGTDYLIQVLPGTKVERNDLSTSLATFIIGELGQAKSDLNGLIWKLEATTI